VLRDEEKTHNRDVTTVKLGFIFILVVSYTCSMADRYCTTVLENLQHLFQGLPRRCMQQAPLT
jgi:hypothetical protein